MSRLLIFFIVLASLRCSPVVEEPTVELNCKNPTGVFQQLAFLGPDAPAKPEPYTLSFAIKEGPTNYPTLQVTVHLAEGAFYVSPHSKRDFKGKFGVNLEDNPHLSLTGDFVETPRTEEEYDPHPFVDGVVNWVRETTTYEYEMTLDSKEDFEVGGAVRFVIEPRCTLEERVFILSMKNGELSVKSTGGC